MAQTRLPLRARLVSYWRKEETALIIGNMRLRSEDLWRSSLRCNTARLLGLDDVAARTYQKLGDTQRRQPSKSKRSQEQKEERHQTEGRKLVIDQAADQETDELCGEKCQYVNDHEGERLHGISSAALSQQYQQVTLLSPSPGNSRIPGDEQGRQVGFAGTGESKLGACWLTTPGMHAPMAGNSAGKECAMTSTLNYAIGAVVLAGLFAIGLAIMIW
jgi:hypothetical protein